MEKIRTNFKYISLAVIIISAISLIRNIIEAAVMGLTATVVPEEMVSLGITTDTLTVMNICSFITGIVILLASTYLGVKGLKIVKTKTETKGHITFGIILSILNIVNLVASITAIADAKNIGFAISAIIVDALSSIIFVAFTVIAKKVAKIDNPELFVKNK